jgi:hypothetical protein
VPRTPEEQKLYMREYRIANREKLCAADRKRHAENREELNAVSRKYYADHKDVQDAKNRQYYADNKARYAEYGKAYYAANREAIIHSQSLDKVGKMLSGAKSRAAASGMDFSITRDDIIIPEFCPYLGIPLIGSGRKGANPNSPSLDRIDSTKGYVPGNVEVISHRANTIKNNSTVEELRLIYTRLSAMV